MNIEIIKNHLKRNYPLYLVFLLGVIIYFAIIYPAINNDLIYYDSVYQYFLTNKNFNEMLELIPKDYSPALYSILLKGFSQIFGTTINNMRLFSVVVFLGLTLTCIFPLRRAFGKKIAIISAICLMFSSSSYHIYGEIRPHVLGLLFVTTAAVYLYLVYKEGQKHDYIMFTVFSILSMNTHNVGMLAMFSYYVMLFVIFLCARKYQEIKKLIISGIACVIFYIPSLLVILTQFGNVKKNYWSDDNINLTRILLNTILLNVNNRPYAETPTYVFILILLIKFALLGLILFVVARTILSCSKTKKFQIAINKDSCFVIALFVVPMLFYYLVVKFVVPVMAERYIYMFSGIALIIVIVLLSKVDKKCLSLYLLSLILVVNFIFTTKNYSSYVNDCNDLSKVQAIKDEYGENIAFVHMYEWTVGFMEYYFPNSRHYITNETHTIITTYDVYSTENIVDVGDPENIKDYEDEFIVVFVTDSYIDWNAYEYYSASGEYICSSESVDYDNNYEYVHFEKIQ